MIAQKKMAPAGLAAFKRLENSRKSGQETQPSREVTISAETKQALRANKKAWENFCNLAPSHKKRYIGWIQSAKKPETRERRLKEAIKSLVKDEKLGMK